MHNKQIGNVKRKKKMYTNKDMAEIREKIEQEKPKLEKTKKRMLVYMEILRQIAKSHDGSVLSRSYINMVTPMEFCCAKGHKFKALPVNITHGHWCPLCGYDRRMTTVGPKYYAELKAAAKRRGGKVLSPEKEYIGSSSLMKFECAKGHEWETRASVVKRGKWCPICGRDKNTTDYANKRRKLVIARLKALVAKKRGKFLGPEYTILKAKYKFMCKKGHIWEATGNNVLLMKSWCPVCRLLSGGKKR